MHLLAQATASAGPDAAHCGTMDSGSVLIRNFVPLPPVALAPRMLPVVQVSVALPASAMVSGDVSQQMI